MDKRKSFTIVELIIVAGVISILVGVLLVALVPARNKAKDAKIIGDLTQIQNRAERLYLDNGKYPSGVCCGAGCDPEIIVLCDDINAQGGSVTLLKRGSEQGNYCAYANLNTKSGGVTEIFCVDYTGFAQKMTSTMCNDNSFSAYVCLECYDFDESGTVDSADVTYIATCGQGPGSPWICSPPGAKPAGCDPNDWGCGRLDLNQNGWVNSVDVGFVTAGVGTICQMRR